MDKILQIKVSRLGIILHSSKQGLKIMKQTYLLFLTKYVCISLTNFCDKLKITLKIARGKSWFFQCRKFIQTYLEINIRSAEVKTTKESSLSLNLLSNSPCFPNMFMVFLFSPLSSSSYFLKRDTVSFGSFTLCTSSFSSG